MWHTSVTETKTRLVYISRPQERLMLRKHSTICRTVSMLSRLRLCLCPSLPTSLFINAVYSSALMEAAEFILKTHKFLPHYTVFLIIVPVRALVLTMSKYPSCVHKKKANLLTYLLTYSMEESPSWEANWFCSQSRNSPHFMEPESSLPYSQAPTTCPYPEPNPSSPHNPFPLPEDPS